MQRLFLPHYDELIWNFKIYEQLSLLSDLYILGVFIDTVLNFFFGTIIFKAINWSAVSISRIMKANTLRHHARCTASLFL